MNIKSGLCLGVVILLLATITWILSWPVVPEGATGAEGSMRVVMGGDFYAGARLEKYGMPEQTRDFLDELPKAIHRADVHLLNLEGPITTRSDTSTEKRYWLKNPPNLAMPLLQGLSVDGVSLANNHTMDYGVEGLRETTRRLRKADIRFAGAGMKAKAAVRPVFFEVEGRRLAFLSFSNTFPKSFWAGESSPGTAYGDPDRVRSAVDSASKNADRVIVSFHWGSESTLQPKEYQRGLARLAINQGADVVFGHHPHSLQPIERYNKGLIFYSLGNFFFSTLSRDVEYGLMADVSFKPNVKRPDYKLHLLRVDNYKVHYRPRLVKTYTNPLALALKIGRLDFIRLAETNWFKPGLPGQNRPRPHQAIVSFP